MPSLVVDVVVVWCFAQDAKPKVMAARAMMERIRILECHPLLCRLHVAGM